MSTRDNTIDARIAQLTEKKTELTELLENLPKFKTNLQVKSGNATFSFRTCATVIDMLPLFTILQNEWNSVYQFNKLLVDTHCEPIEAKSNGFTREDWEHDIAILCTKINANAQLNKVNKALTELEKFYSGDRKEENAFNALLSEIDAI